MFYAKSTAMGHIAQGEAKCIATTSQILIHCGWGGQNRGPATRGGFSPGRSSTGRFHCGARVAQLVQRRTQDFMTRGSNPIRSTQKIHL